MYKIKFLLFYLIISMYAVIGALIIPSCGSVNLFTPQDDLALGEQISEQIESNPVEYPKLQDPEIKNYVQEIVNTILRSPEIKYKGQFSYKTEIINNDNVVNAFCTPGGFIYVYTGLIKFVDNEATLAGVLAHEIAHAEQRHSTERITTAYGAQLLAGIVLGNNPDKATEIAANLFTGLGLLKNSRNDELESDEYSFRYLRSTKWYPGAIKMFFDKIIGAGTQKGSDLERLLSTHPLPQDRIDATIQRMKEADIPPPNEQNLFTRKYQKIKTGI